MIGWIAILAMSDDSVDSESETREGRFIKGEIEQNFGFKYGKIILKNYQWPVTPTRTVPGYSSNECAAGTSLVMSVLSADSGTLYSW